nr:MAG TPA: hypothetical protein [Caudoviricetes sp.]
MFCRRKLSHHFVAPTPNSQRPQNNLDIFTQSRKVSRETLIDNDYYI